MDTTHGPVAATWFGIGQWPTCRCGFAPRDNGRLTAHWDAHGFRVVDDSGRLKVIPHHTAENVTTWADGFGVWHARIDFPGIGYGDALDAEWDRIRAKARRAIRRELDARGEGYAPGAACRIEVVASREHPSANTTMSVTFAEAVR